jgi:hypothetical protein
LPTRAEYERWLSSRLQQVALAEDPLLVAACGVCDDPEEASG